MALDSASNAETIYRYKYLPFTEGSLKVITEGTLKFTCPLEFNDPFDCMPSYSPESIENIFKTRPDLIRRVGDQLKLSPAKRLQRKGVFIQNVRRVVESGEYVRALVSGLGVLSLSRTAANILMWSHYAAHHKGFVVELEISMAAPMALVHEIIPFPVAYAEKRPVFDWATGSDIEGYFLTKSIDWEYEQEERTLNTTEGPGIHPYSREHFLCSVIAGSKMADPEFEQLKAAVKKASEDVGKSIPLYRAELARDKYTVYVPGHCDPLLNQA